MQIKKNSFSLEFMSPVSPIQWGSENRTCLVFEWLTLVQISHGPVFKCFKNKLAAKWPRLVNHLETGQNVRFSNGLLA